MAQGSKGKAGKVSKGGKSTIDSQTLDPKFRNILDKSVISSYEQEKFEFAIKEADRILKVYPGHGETLAMKGLCTHCIALRREGQMKQGNEVKENGKMWTMADINEMKIEAIELINEGLRQNVKSGISWRVKGLVHKAEKDWDNSARAFKMALMHDKHNKVIMNDISQICTSTRNYGELEKIRKQLWDREHNQANAVGYLFALYLNNNYLQCQEFLDSFLTDFPNIANFEPVALNEICLFKAKLLNKLSQYEACVQFIDEKLKLKEIKDQIQALTLKSDILKKLGKSEECLQVYKELIEINPENSKFLKEYVNLSVKCIKNKNNNKNENDKENDKENENENELNEQTNVEKLFSSLNEKYPKSATIERIRLDYLKGKEFRDKMDAFLRKKISKSVISVYNEIKSLYEDSEKGQILTELIDSYVENLTKDRRFSPNDEKNSAAPSCLLWVNYYRGSHLLDSNEFTEALKVIDETLKWVPTCIDLYVLKARVYKYGGDAQTAFDLLNKAREMDTADRFLNTKCTRYALRAGKADKAEEIVRLFLKPAEGVKVLQSLQVMWYELHKADCHCNDLSEYSIGLREYEHVFSHFEKFWESQIDFQAYAYRKVAVSSYLAMLKWEDHLRNHPFFVRAGIGAVKNYIKVYKIQKQFGYDCANNDKNDKNDNNNKENNEKKKENSEFNKLMENKEYLDAVLKGSKPDSEIDSSIKRSLDAFGWTLMHNLESPLNEAARWMKHLSQVDRFNNDFEYDTIHALNIELNLLSKNYKECGQAIENTFDANKNVTIFNNPRSFAQTVCAVQCAEDEKLDKESEELIQNAKNNLLNKDVNKTVKDYFEQSKDLNQLIAVGRCIVDASVSSVDLKDVSKKMIGIACTLPAFREARSLLLSKQDPNLQAFEQSFLKSFPLCRLNPSEQ